MAVTYQSAAPWASAWFGDFALNHGLPASIAAGDGIVVCVSIKSSTNVLPAAPAGYTLVASGTGGAGTFGVDTGPSAMAIYWREAAGGETTVTIPLLASGGGATCSGLVDSFRFTKGAGESWATPTGTGGADSSDGTAYSAAGAAGIALASGDLILAATVLSTDVANTLASESIAAAGATISAPTLRRNTASDVGNDSRQTIWTAPVTAGSSFAAPTFAMTMSAPASGAMAMARLRAEVSGNVAAPVAILALAAPVPAVAGGAPLALVVAPVAVLSQIKADHPVLTSLIVVTGGGAASLDLAAPAPTVSTGPGGSMSSIIVSGTVVRGPDTVEINPPQGAVVATMSVLAPVPVVRAGAAVTAVVGELTLVAGPAASAGGGALTLAEAAFVSWGGVVPQVIGGGASAPLLTEAGTNLLTEVSELLYA